jgi:hypothetical protein
MFFTPLKIQKILKHNPVKNAKLPTVRIGGNYDPNTPVVDATLKYKRQDIPIRLIVSPFRTANTGRYFIKLTETGFNQIGQVAEGLNCQIITQTKHDWNLIGVVKSTKTVNNFKQIEVVVNFSENNNRYYDQYVVMSEDNSVGAAYGV